MSVIASARGVTRNYQQGPHTVRALRGVDLEVVQGDFLALMGPSGSGKSTLLNVFGGLDLPTEGDINIDGHDLAQLSKSELSDLRRDRMGFIFQAYNLIPVLTAYENAEFVLLLRGTPAAECKAIVMEMLAVVGLQGMENRRPNELSGGQQQRVAVARAIAGKPALVLADEPTANLDSETGHALIDMMRDLNREHGITFVFATHDPKVMKAANRVVCLEDGHIISDDRQ
jgi:putative ABC transport system ATP-binding protein